MYKAIEDFTDEINGTRIGYKKGEEYPKGYVVPPERIEYLLSSKTFFGRPVICLVEDGENQGNTKDEQPSSTTEIIDDIPFFSEGIRTEAAAVDDATEQKIEARVKKGAGKEKTKQRR